MKFNLLLHSGIASLSLFACGVNAATDLGPAGIFISPSLSPLKLARWKKAISKSIWEQ